MESLKSEIPQLSCYSINGIMKILDLNIKGTSVEKRKLILSNIKEEKVDEINKYIVKRYEELRKRGLMCEFEGCKILPTYNIPGSKFALYCSKHKEINMINVKDKVCEFEGCKIRPHYNIPGFSAIYCVRHKTKKMVRNPTKRCESNCNNIATHAIQGSIASHCELHALENYINIYEQNCGKCELPNIVNKKGFCEYCDPETFKIARLAKQNEVEEYLKTNLSEYFTEQYFPQTDKIIDRGICGKERPDFLFDFGDKYVIVEVDENQHCGYNSTEKSTKAMNCEYARMFNISQSLGGIPTIFIRYNPDKYYNDAGFINIKSTSERKNELVNVINFYKDRDLIKDNNIDVGKTLAYAIYLFYNNDSPMDRKLVPIMSEKIHGKAPKSQDN